MSDSYVPIRLNTIRTDENLPFSIYLSVSGKYLLYVREGDEFANDRYRNLKQKKVKRLYIPPEDEEKYQQFLDSALNAAINDKEMKANDRAEIVGGMAQSAVMDMEEDPDSKISFKNSQNAVKAMMEVINGNPDVLKEMFNLQSSEEELVVMSAIKTASLVLRVGKAYGYNSEKLSNLGLAALFRDLGKSKIDSKYHYLFNKDYSKFSQSEWEIYGDHPKLSVEMVADKDYINSDIKELILTHEEKLQGGGFPQKLHKLSKEQEILSLCNCYDYYVTCLGLLPTDAVKKISLDEIGKYELETISKFKEILKKENLI